MIILMVAASKHNVETECHTQKLCQEKTMYSCRMPKYACALPNSCMRRFQIDVKSIHLDTDYMLHLLYKYCICILMNAFVPLLFLSFSIPYLPFPSSFIHDLGLLKVSSCKGQFSLPVLLVLDQAVGFCKVPRDNSDCSRHCVNTVELN